MKIDGKKVIFIGNSFTYYGDCVRKGGAAGSIDDGYFYKIAKSFGDEVTVTNFTVGDGKIRYDKAGAVTEKSLYDLMVTAHPGKDDPIYDQDYVIFQQAGSNIPTTYTDALEMKALFPSAKKFFFYITSHDLSSNHVPTLEAAEKLRGGHGFGYIPLGHLVYDIWTGKTKLPGTVIDYGKYTFVVNRSKSDGYHPNQLTGYLTALMTYAVITKEKVAGADASFIKSDGITYYDRGDTNYPDVLMNPSEILKLQKLVDDYAEKFN